MRRVTEHPPDQPSLRGPHLRIERAGSHLEYIERKGREYFDRNPYRLSEQPRREDDWWVVRIEQISEWPDPLWAVIVGEFAHNLRAALDNLVWQLVLLHGQEEPGDHNEFPIHVNPAKPPSAEWFDHRLRGVKPGHRALIEEVQPYLGEQGPKAGARIALLWLRWLNNTDKHRFLHPTLGVWEQQTAIGPLVADRPGGPIDIQIAQGALYEGAVFLRFRSPDTPDAQMYVQAEKSVNVAFGDPKITPERLRAIRDWVTEIVKWFEPDFPGPPEPA